MSLFGRPVIFLPEAGQWDSSRRPRVSGIPRRHIRRRRPYPGQVSRHPLEYIFDVDPFDDVYEEDYPEESIYDMTDLPVSYLNAEPRPFYVFKGKMNPEYEKPEEAMKKERRFPQKRHVQKSERKSIQSNDVERQTKNKHDDVVVMDLDDLVGRLFRSVYGVESKARGEPKTNMATSRTGKGQGREEKVKETPNQKSSETETTTTNNLRRSVMEKTTANNSERNEVNMENDETEKINDDTTSKGRDEVINREKIRMADESESDEVQLIFVVDENRSENTKNDNLMDSSRNLSEAEGMEETSREMEREGEDVCHKLSEVSSSPQENKSDPETEVSNPHEVHEPMGKKEVERTLTEEELGKFQMTFDLSSFLPEEIQVKLSDERLVLDAVHEEVKEGLIEKRSVQKVITLPPGVDTDSLRCLLGDDGHMTISANYLEKRKESKTLTIEMQTNTN